MNPILLDIPEIIKTDRLELLVPKAGMGKAVQKAILDGYDDNIKWLGWEQTPPTIDQVEAECREDHAQFILRKLIRYVIFDKENGKVLGRCAYPPFQVNWKIPQFGISYFIRKSERRKGYASEASLAMAKMAFQKLNAQKVEIYCDDENISSKKVPEKLGFKLEYTQKGGWPRTDNKLATLLTYSVFSESDLLEM